MDNKIIYLDYAATTPVDPKVIDVMVQTMQQDWGNISSDHAIGQRAKEKLSDALDKIAQFFNIKRNEIIITSGATESINQAIKGVMYAQKKKHLITSTIEHKATLQAVHALLKEGYHATFIAPNSDGKITPEMVKSAIISDTALISFIWANNETGELIEVESIAALARQENILFHIDATQTVPHLKVDASKFDLLSMSGHKCYGPKGIGLLYKRHFPRVDLKPLIDGSGGQLGIRAGTIPNEQVVGLAEALLLCEMEFETLRQQHQSFVAFMLSELAHLGVERNIRTASFIDSTINLYIPNVHADSLIALLPHICIAKGSACNTDDALPSYVLTEMGYGDRRALQSIRISFGRYTTKDEIESATHQMIQAIIHLQNCAKGISSIFEGYIEKANKNGMLLQIAEPSLIETELFEVTHSFTIDQPDMQIEMFFSVNLLGIITHINAKVMASTYILFAVNRLVSSLRGESIVHLESLKLEEILNNNIPTKNLHAILQIEKHVKAIIQ